MPDLKSNAVLIVAVVLIVVALLIAKYSDFRNNPAVQFAVLVLAVTGGQILLKLGVSFLPDSGLSGAAKAIIGKAG